MEVEFNKLSPKEFILIKGAKLHNLKNIDVAIPRNKLVVITGLSGSGKSSLAFDTLYAEGQRRYVESLSSYARQFLGKLSKPKVDYIKGISPAIAIEQKVNATNPRSTVGTSTEIYDYLKLLYARIGTTYSPISNEIVKKNKVTDVIDYIKTTEEGEKILLLAPIKFNSLNQLEKIIKILAHQGFSRLKMNDEVLKIDEYRPKITDQLFVVVDRIIVQHHEDFYFRLADAVQIAFNEGNGVCILENLNTAKTKTFSTAFELDGITFLEPSVHLFSFNNPYGACPKCEGYGNIIGIDEELVIPNTSLSILDDAIVPFKSDSFSHFKEALILNASKYNIPIHKPWFKIEDNIKSLIWEGTKDFDGIHNFFKHLEEKSYKIQYRVMLSRYRGKTKCTVCQGKRLRKEAQYVKINEKSITDLVELPLDELAIFTDNLSLTNHEKEVSKRLLTEINTRLGFLNNIGLGYLTLNRNANTLSGGESQRINLATSLGSSLVGSMYILDEPSIGLHSKDTERLIVLLKKLRDIGNTVIVVEHDEDIIKSADYIIDIGPEAGVFGGELIAQGNYDTLLKSNSLTAQYLNQKLQIEIPKNRRITKNFIEIEGARAHNLKNINVKFPLNSLTVVTGVSGSGKSTLVRNILYPALMKKLSGNSSKVGEFTDLKGSFQSIKQIEFVDQNPIGRSSRSNPVTYIKAYDDIRNLFAGLNLSVVRNYKPKHFSFNVDGGRCDVCKGEGDVTIEMQFMADVHMTCEVCNGKRFQKEILEVKFHDKSIVDVLEMSVGEAIDFFNQTKESKIAQKLLPLQEVGLGYVQLGQSSSTLSGGEAQRIKLASFLIKGTTTDKTLFIFDEPTTGLHFHDIKKLLKSFNALIEKGHSIIVIEHNLELIKCADYIIDLGIDGGKKGGDLLFEGTPEALLNCQNSYTAYYLKDKL
ncbi:MAG: excinuclease ABC subunit UvrA [Flavobacteriaceae bacterium]|nr:excinuclease ABC subunit UvrA [Flavobacteriaceae bacterium]